MKVRLTGLEEALAAARACRLCAPDLPLGPRPVVRLSPTVKLLIISQAPGTKVHASGLPFDDASGDRLRAWLAMDKATFYDASRVGFMPMGFCYPGRLTRGGDAPPRAECAPTWHGRLRAFLPVALPTLLVGRYAQEAYLPPDWLKLDVAERCRRWLAEGGGQVIPLVHPSPRNQLWLRRNPWFEDALVPRLRRIIWDALGKL